MMSWVWMLLILNLALTAGLTFFIWKTLRHPKDDPRLSRGLQLLQSKIAILEDISDRTEIQVRQLITLMDQKIKEVRQKIHLAEKHVQLVAVSMEKSREVAKIFEDRIPHEEIIERQTTTHYVRAAKMAHQGRPLEEIAQEVPLPKAELELLLKLNKQQLMFSEDLLPDWLQERVESSPALSEHLDQVETEFHATSGPTERAMEEALHPPSFEDDELKALGERFRQACKDVEGAEEEPEAEPEREPTLRSQGTRSEGAVIQEKVPVQRVKFPRLQL